MHQETTHILKCTFSDDVLETIAYVPIGTCDIFIPQSCPSHWALEQFLDYQKGLVSRPPGVVNLEMSLNNWVCAPTEHTGMHPLTATKLDSDPNLIAQKDTRRTSSPIRGTCIVAVRGCCGLPGFLGERAKLW
jgi:hypothetical protein